MVNRTEYRNPVDVLGEEFLDRRRRGDSVDIEEYAHAHPRFAEEIRRLFSTMVAMEKIKATKLSSSGVPVRFEVERVQQLGDYRIIREIGRGGMGVVYEAEQQSLARNVAVKVFPRQTLHDSRQLKRFRREARTAASLHHTNIVPVFGVGEQDGLHYYVMQRIDGTALDEFVSGGVRPHSGDAAAHETTGETPEAASTNANGFDGSEQGCARLNGRALSRDRDECPPAKSLSELAANRIRKNRDQWRGVTSIGIQVADALDYAHAQGVIHRDIKPSNLLLDPRGTVWVTDFGLARVLEAEKLSNPGDVGGTLRFMAPEHVGGEQDARSDIYSLGLTLYELLTGHPAFEEESQAELIRKILKGEITQPRLLRPEIPRDLEAIVLKAIACEPKRRYKDAASLAADLRRFSEGRPVRAHRIGPVGRLTRWTHRNPAVASLSASLLLVALCSFALVGAKWREAVEESRRAEDNLALALESMDQILERFASSWMAHPTATETVDGEAAGSGIEFQMAVSDYSASVLQDTLKFYDRFAEQNATNPQLRRDTAKVHRRVADIYDRLGQYSKAEQAYERSLRILNSELINDDEDLAIEKANTLNHLGLTMYATSRFTEAEAVFQRAKTVLLETPHHSAPKCLAELARTNNNLGRALWRLRRTNQAEQSHRQAVQLLEDLVGQHPENSDYRLALARAYRIYYPFVVFGRQRGDRDRIRNAGIKILEELVQSFPNVPDYQCELSEMLVTTSRRHRGSRSVVMRSEQCQRAVQIARQLCVTHPSIPRYRAVLARTLKEQAKILSTTKRVEADELYGESANLYRSLTRDFADIPTYHTLLAMVLHDHAEYLRASGRAADARVVSEEGIAAQQGYVDLLPNNRFGTRLLARFLEEHAQTLTSLDVTDEADQALQKALRLRKQSANRDGPQL